MEICASFYYDVYASLRLEAYVSPHPTKMPRVLDYAFHLLKHWLVKRENAEREALGALPLYQRTLP